MLIIKLLVFCIALFILFCYLVYKQEDYRAEKIFPIPPPTSRGDEFYKKCPHCGKKIYEAEKPWLKAGVV